MAQKSAAFEATYALHAIPCFQFTEIEGEPDKRVHFPAPLFEATRMIENERVKTGKICCRLFLAHAP
jgi:hypothetical protein